MLFVRLYGDIGATVSTAVITVLVLIFGEITPKNVVEMCMYNSIRHCIDDTWINDRDIFHSPNDSWRGDRQFQHDCLIYTLFHNSNNIRSAAGVNHWIPFSEGEVDAREAFDSHFMSDYLKGLYRPAGLRQDDLFAPSPADSAHGGAIELSAEAMRVLKGVEDIAICRLTAQDVVRHVLVQRIIAAYDKYEKTQEGKRNSSHGKDQGRY